METVSKIIILSDLHQLKETKNILHSLEFRGKSGAAKLQNYFYILYCLSLSFFCPLYFSILSLDQGRELIRRVVTKAVSSSGSRKVAPSWFLTPPTQGPTSTFILTTALGLPNVINQRLKYQFHCRVFVSQREPFIVN